MAKPNCKVCGKPVGWWSGSDFDPEIHIHCAMGLENKERRQVFEAAVENNEKHSAALQAVKLTTGYQIAGCEIESEIDVITAECAFGMNIFRDMFAAGRDLVGGRSKATQKVLRDARKTCLDELRSEALQLGADAVIGVDLDYSEFSGGGKAMLFLVASGTAVKLRDTVQ